MVRELLLIVSPEIDANPASSHPETESQCLVDLIFQHIMAAAGPLWLWCGLWLGVGAGAGGWGEEKTVVRLFFCGILTRQEATADVLNHDVIGILHYWQ